MKADDLRKAFRTKPYRPLDIVMNSGDRYRCPSPEIVIGESLVAVLESDGRIALLDLESIAAVEQSKRKTRGQPTKK
ncbi:MAG: hypothetical protein NUW37_00235 [Planctomycetes bacterium]|nr:hypothetical protein [Planctomycetota bacterium]